MKHCVVNFANGFWYPRGQARLCQSLHDTGYDGKMFTWQDEKQIGVLPHSTAPYAFKMAAFNHAADEGYDTILWCDAAVWAQSSIMPLLDYINKQGHIFFENYSGCPTSRTVPWNCAEWTSDACLTEMNISRDEAEKIPQYMGCCFGLSLNFSRSVEFLNNMTSYSLDGITFPGVKNITFPGACNNDNQTVSTDPRCLGHRYDQSVGSILAYQMSIELINGDKTFFQSYNNPQKTTFRYGSADNDMSLINPNLCLLTQGM